MSNRKKRPLNRNKHRIRPEAVTPRVSEFQWDLIMAGVALASMIGILSWLNMVLSDVRMTYDNMYIQLQEKGPDYRTTLDFYRYCSANRRLRSTTLPSCMDETESWAKRQGFTTPFEIIARDIREGEARAYLDSRS